MCIRDSFSGINPYALGFAMFSDIRRICEEPTDEDREWFPNLAGTDWLPAMHAAMRDFKDESFIQQYLSPKVIRDLRLFGVLDDAKDDHYKVAAIHDDQGYARIRSLLAAQYNLGDQEPNIQIVSADVSGDRALTLHHLRHQGRPLNSSTEAVLKHVHLLWGFPVHMESLTDGRVVARQSVPQTEPEQEHLIWGSAFTP